MISFQSLFNTLGQGNTLSSPESAVLMTSMLSGEVSQDRIIALFEIFEKRFPTAEEFAGFLQATREAMVRVEVPFDCIDTCGTGGDGLDTFNISTLSAFVVAACDTPVAKHGNRSSSGKCGSADVLEKTGVQVELNKEEAQACLKQTGIAFLFAPAFHPAFRHVGPARKAYGKRTFFNFLGPIVNPALCPYQVIGVSDGRFIDVMGEALIRSGSKKVWLVHSDDGMDEISPCAPTTVHEFMGKGGVAEKNSFVIDPGKYGFETYPLPDIQTQTPEENVHIFQQVLDHTAREAQTAAVILNAAAALVVYGTVRTLQQGIDMARDVLASHAAKRKFEEYRKKSHNAK